MDIVFSLIIIVHVVIAVAIIVLVLLQHGKGADMGAAFGSGASGSLFGATGSANFLSRATAVLAAVFFLTSLGLTWFATHRTTGASSGVMGTVPGAAPADAKAGKGDAAKSDAVPGDAKPAAGGDVPKAADKADAAKPDGAAKGSEVPK